MLDQDGPHTYCLSRHNIAIGVSDHPRAREVEAQLPAAASSRPGFGLRHSQEMLSSGKRPSGWCRQIRQSSKPAPWFREERD